VKKSLIVIISVTAGGLLFLANGVTFAQEDEAEAIEEIEVVVTIGTRRRGRTAIATAVPIDVLNLEDLDSVSSDDLLDVMKTLVPSFQVRRFPSSDGRTFIRPAQLRGMSSDKTLVLVNGKRRHRASLVRLAGEGAHGPDLATIPGIAIKSVEVLRDGASALYGSDAIAGVFNFNLRDDDEGGEIRVQTGMYSGQNESGYLIALNQGFGLGESGFVNISAELSDNEQTSRGTFYDFPIAQSGLTPAESALVSGLFDHDGDPTTPDQQRYGPDALTEIYEGGFLSTVIAGTDGIPDDVNTRYADNLEFAELSSGPLEQVWGEPDRDAIRTFVNAGLTLDNDMELYGWANYSDSNGNTSFFHRRAGDPVLSLLRTPDGAIYDPRSRFPAGFTPRFFGNVIDASVTGGIRGEFSNGLIYDVGARWGESTIKYAIRNTMNPSIGPATPNDFRPGELINTESALSADFSKPFDVGFASDLNVAFGFEYRDALPVRMAAAWAVSSPGRNSIRPVFAIRETRFTIPST
jgi:iron complex outermembrane receptor protein